MLLDQDLATEPELVLQEEAVFPWGRLPNRLAKDLV